MSWVLILACLIVSAYHTDGASASLATNTASSQVLTVKGDECYFPFIYDGKIFQNCTTYQSVEKPWCSLTQIYDDDDSWGYCATKCRGGMWGTNCTRPCNCKDNCNYVTGVCPSECSPGWTGDKCQRECRGGMWGTNCTRLCNCKDNCNYVTGVCPSECSPGWTGDKCQRGNVANGKSAEQYLTYATAYYASRGTDGVIQPCDTNIAHPSAPLGEATWWRVDLESRHVIYNVTVAHRQGLFDRLWDTVIGIGNDKSVYSHQQCAYIYVNDPDLNTTTALITKQCEPPLVGRYVSLRRNDNATQKRYMNFCEVLVEGFKVCSGNMWGPKCLSPCNCKHQCDATSGVCSTQCTPGWTGDTCQTVCSNNTWGDYCRFSCNCESQCDAITGNCSSQCVAGWRGDTCQQACENGTWGSNCSSQCNCRDPCDHITGVCHAHCTPGWTGNTCQEGCSDGHWGLNCGQKCGCMNITEICSKSTGTCISGCRKWHIGVGCEIVLPSMSTIQIKVAARKPSSVLLQFPPWNTSLEGSIAPNKYILQYRTDDMKMWTNGDDVDHKEDIMIAMTLNDVVPGMIYQLKIIPVYIKGEEYQGEPSAMMWYIEITQSGFSTYAIGISGSLLAIIISIFAATVICYVSRQRRKSPEEKACTNSSNTEMATISNNELVMAIETRHRKVSRENMDQIPGSSTEEIDELLYENIPGRDSQSTPVPVWRLAAHISLMKNEPKAFEKEYQNLPRGVIAKWDKGNTTGNMKKNRFVNIRAYDHSRVFLQSRDASSDYINANYIKGYKDKQQHYIASQGPRKQTIGDMWQMIWQEGANRIVMVTNLKEKRKDKCHLYWPTKGQAKYGTINVCFQSEEKMADFTVRHFSVKLEDTSRIIHQFHFTSWPDHGVPEFATALLQFHRKVHSYDEQATGPMIVHCSAGVGRTGTFIAIDYLLEQAKAEQQVDVPGCVTRMRQDRIDMVQTLGQYTFVHDALLEALISGETTILASRFHLDFMKLSEMNPIVGKSKLQEQYEVLEVLKPARKFQELEGCKHENVEKGTRTEPVPGLMESTEATEATPPVYINGYRTNLAYVTTKSPSQKTLTDFWNLVYDLQSCTILMLNQCGENKKAASYWPEDSSPESFGPLLVEHTSTDKPLRDAINIRDFTVAHAKKSRAEPHHVKQFEVCCWAENQNVPSSRSAVLEMLDLVERWQQQSGNGPVIIHCLNGFSRSGLLVAAMYMLDKLKAEQEVDVFSIVKHIRLRQPNFVESMEQYIYLHKLAGDFMDSFSEYANFQ